MDDDGLEVPEGFELLADEKRARILYALSRQLRDDPESPALEFAELRKAAEVRDSGNFNYHLQKLLGRYVEHGPDGEGYALTYQGILVVAALVGGEYAATEEYGPEPYGGCCPVCDGDLEVRYAGGVVHLDCEANDEHGMAYNVPPHAVDPDALDEAARLMASRAYAETALLLDGRCPLCFGDVDHSLETPAETVAPAFRYTCDRCGNHYALLLGMTAMHHPEVVGFYDDHGVDLRSTPTELLRFAREDAVEPRGDGFEFTVELDDERLVVAVEADTTVAAVERT